MKSVCIGSEATFIKYETLKANDVKWLRIPLLTLYLVFQVLNTPWLCSYRKPE
jgi:hypothetical protein